MVSCTLYLQEQDEKQWSDKHVQTRKGFKIKNSVPKVNRGRCQCTQTAYSQQMEQRKHKTQMLEQGPLPQQPPTTATQNGHYWLARALTVKHNPNKKTERNIPEEGGKVAPNHASSFWRIIITQQPQMLNSSLLNVSLDTQTDTNFA